ncbi:RNA helicase [Malassezia sp. CBS 17886]|nr:RNA helicase [Malassezia sp. CBS 17886]
MDDDGLLLNLDTSAPPPRRKRKAAGRDGRRDGAPEQDAERKRPRGDGTGTHGGAVDAAAATHAAPPRPRAHAVSVPGAPRGAPAPQRGAFAPQRGVPAPHTTRAPPAGGYISSLFPRDHVGAEEPTAVPAPPRVAPSNAPSGDTSFEALGVDRLLADHLRARMHIPGKPTEIQRLALPPLLAAPPADTSTRDVLMQAQTGSGKTLTYLLPIIQSLLPLSEESFIDRSVGTLAIILAPTRELARQIHQVLERLLTLSLAVADDEGASRRYARWIVPGLLTGGSTKNHEKQRLRKGCPILVATPGRLLDHLQNTSSLDVGKCRWLVLDEADRLLEMGFEEQLTGIVKALEGRRRLSLNFAREALVASGVLPKDAPPDESQLTDSLGIAWWAWRRRVVLCSATLDERVQVFSGTALHDPLLVRAGGGRADAAVPASPVERTSPPSPGHAGGVAADATAQGALASPGAPTPSAHFTAPSQLQQHAVFTPPKLRLVALAALLRRTVRGSDGASRVIVFLSCTDSVDFHWRALGGARMGDAAATEPTEDALVQYSELLPSTPLYRLHGSMTQKERIASLRAFHRLADEPSGKAPEGRRGGILFCTSVASRGLDLPDVRCVVQMDIPTEGVEEYVHRVGRTARAGRDGSSWLFLLPHETPWLRTLEQRMVTRDADGRTEPAHVQRVACDTVLYEGLGGAAREYESRATDVQMALERWVLADTKNATLARTAFLAHVRAYATHPTSEKALLNVNQLHLGHLAKAFALRETPNAAQKTSKREHERKAKAEDTASGSGTRQRRMRMLANLPTESM